MFYQIIGYHTCIDLLLLMTVRPGCGWQAYLLAAMKKALLNGT